MNQAIPEAAVEAAARYLGDRFFWDSALLDGVARSVLEAAAPHMLAEVWDQAIEAHKAWTWDDEDFDPLVNPYRPTP